MRLKNRLIVLGKMGLDTLYTLASLSVLTYGGLNLGVGVSTLKLLRKGEKPSEIEDKLNNSKGAINRAIVKITFPARTVAYLINKPDDPFR
ncbi:MAG: hypothetical protein KC506_00045 [Nanoarchaeota archaeon]|nr:hypothetical protein [Nanoarchaeota archaeon]